MTKKYLLVGLFLVLMVMTVLPLISQVQDKGNTPVFNPEKATDSYLARLSPEAKAKSVPTGTEVTGLSCSTWP